MTDNTGSAWLDDDFEPASSPEMGLIAEVLHQAVRDLTRPAAGDKGIAAAADARAFCFNTSGPWAQSRTLLCELLDIDPETFRCAVMDKVGRSNIAREAAYTHSLANPAGTE